MDGGDGGVIQLVGIICTGFPVLDESLLTEAVMSDWETDIKRFPKIRIDRICSG